MKELERNLAALYGRHPELRDRRLEERPEGDLAIVPAASGSPTALADGSYVHSRYDPLKEARRLVEHQIPKGASAVLFFSFGLGYLPEAFLALRPQRPFVVVEPDLGLFRQALACRDLSVVLSSPQASWRLGEEPEQAVMGLDSLPLSAVRILSLRPLYLRRLAYFRKLEALVQILLDRREVNLNTLRRFGRLWVRNLLRNLPHFLAAPGVGRLEGLFRGVPALIMAGGPSLDPVLEHLPRLWERMLLVAVDTSYPLCRRSGVEPDFLVTVDPQYWNTRHLDWTDFGRVILVSEPSANPRTFHRAPADLPALYFVSSFFPIGQFLEDITGLRGKVGAGGSVATTAWDLARLAGAGPLYMAGLDLGYPGRRTHCRGAFFEELSHAVASRIEPAELASFRALTAASPFPVRSNSGGSVLTDRRMIIYQWWFENQMKQQRELVRTFSLAPEGASIEGMPFQAPESLLELPPARRRIDERLEQARAWAGAAGADKAAERVHEALRLLAEDLNELAALAERGLELCAPLKGEAAGALEALDALDRQILQLASRQVAGFLFQPLIHKILDSAAGTREEALGLSEELYRELAASSRYQADLIRRALSRMLSSSG